MKTFIKRFFLLVGFIFLINNAFSQITSRNGYYFPSTGTIRVLLVFAEVTGYAWDTSPSTEWPAGQLPLNADDYFDPTYTGPGSINGFMTDYFYNASFGDLIILGDYVDQIFSIDQASLSGTGDDQVFAWLNGLPGSDITTHSGYSFNNDFDNFTTNTTPGALKTAAPDNYIDVVIIMWRTNSNISTTDNSGSVNLSPKVTTVKSKNGFMGWGRFISYNSNGKGTLRHEFSHGLYGSNSMHNAGPNHGTRTFISPAGGYSNMGGYDRVFEGVNAWDRNRMGWKTAGTTNYIHALCPVTLTEANSDLVYNGSFPCASGEFILRDFVTYGDAIRIKLPNLQADNLDVRSQWIWIENHQSVVTDFDITSPSPKGIYMYYQVGKDDLTDFGGPNNYTNPINAYGNFDVTIDEATTNLIINTTKANPLSGYHLWMSPSFDTNDDDIIISERYTDADGDGSIHNEHYFPSGVIVDGVSWPASNFRAGLWPQYGTVYDGFTAGRKITMSSNPSTSSIYTYETIEDGVNATAKTTDNRVIRLNNLSIEVVEQLGDGSVKVKIKYDDYIVTNSIRWCGNIALHDKLYPQSTSIITLDRGLVPTRPNVPLVFAGEKIFTDPTILTLRSGSETIMSNTSKFQVINQSTIVADGGSVLTMNNSSNINLIDESWLIAETNSNITLNTNSYITIDDGATMQIKNDANVILKNNSYILVKNGGKLIIEPGDNLELRNNAKIIVEDGGFFIFNGNDLFLNGTNTIVQLKANGTIQTADNVDFTFTGTGYLYYYKDGIFDLGVNSNFVLQGTGDTDRKMWVGTNALLYIANHNVTVNDCRLDYNSGATFKMTGNTVSFDNVFVNDGLGTAGHAIYAYNTDDLTVNSSDFTGFSSTILLEDIDVCPNDINVKIDYSTFVNHDFAAVEAYNVERMRFFTSTATGQTGVTAGLFLEDVDECLVDNSTITNYTLTSVDAGGIFCHRVGALILDGSSIRDNTDVVEARATNIFVRNSAEIKNNTNGIYMMSSHDGTTNPASM